MNNAKTTRYDRMSLSVNAHGMLVLNTHNLMIADIDFSDPSIAKESLAATVAQVTPQQ